MASQDNVINKITSIEEGEQQQQISTKSLSPEKQANFENFLEQKKIPNQVTADPQAVDQVDKKSLYDPTGDLHMSNNNLLTREELIAQADTISAKIESVKQALSAENITIKPGYKTKLGNKLDHINESLRIAVEKTAPEGTPVANAPASEFVNPIQKFLGQMSHAQYQMDSIQTYLSSMNENQGRLNPANMLAIQMKVYGVQQEMELFTNMLNKALESTKTIMNVQV